MKLTDQERALKLRERCKEIEWLTAKNTAPSTLSIPLKNMHIEHLENAIHFIKANFPSENQVLKRQGVFTKKQWISMMEVELYYRLSRRFNKFSYADALYTLEILFDLDCYHTAEDYVEAEFIEIEAALNSEVDYSIMSLTEEEVRARHILSSYSRGSVPIKENTGLYTLRSTLRSRVKARGEMLYRPPFREDEWLAIVELEIAYRAKKPNSKFFKIYRQEIATIMKKLESSNKDNNIVEIRPKLPKVVAEETTEYCVYKLGLSEAGILTPIFGSISSEGVTFSGNGYTLFKDETDVVALADVLNKYNTDPAVEYKYGTKCYAVAVKNTFLVYKTEKDKALYFSAFLDEATSFKTKKAAEEAREKVLLVFESLKEKDVTVQPHITEEVNKAKGQHTAALPQAQ